MPDHRQRRLAVGRAIVVALAFRVSTAAAEGAVGAHAPCEIPAPTIVSGVDETFVEAAKELPNRLREALSRDECGGARVEISAPEPGSSPGVVVQWADGRRAKRHVKTARLLYPTVLGLLAAPEPSDPPKPSVPSPARASPISARDDARDLPDFSPPSPPSPTVARDVGLSVGVSVGARGGMVTDVAMAELELFVRFSIQRWLVVGSVRYVPIAWAKGLTPDGDAYEEAAMSLAFGHRFAWGRSALDLAVVPTLVLVTMENDSPVEVSGSLADFRMGACLRYGYALSKKWQFQAALDTEVSPGALMRDRVPAPGLDPLPVWTAGLRVGFAAQVF